MTSNTSIIVDTQRHIGRLTLNRPKALNALDLDMIRAMTKALLAWRDDDNIHGVVVDAVGGKAFCAGGDVRALVDGKHDADYARSFYTEEYRLNTLIKEYPKPYVAMVDGIVMGGGVGISVHGARRICGDTSLFAMPETGIGFYPDVGGSYFLPRLQGFMGTYLALSGARLKAPGMVALGIATDYAPSDQHAQIIMRIIEDTHAPTDIGRIIDSLTGRPEKDTLGEHRALIDKAFGMASVEDVIQKLQDDDGDWARQQCKILRSKSPTALKITLRQMREGANLDFRSCMKMELGLSLACVAGADFAEGVRAVLIDRDNAPKWQPARLDAVSDDDVARYFIPLPADQALTFLEGDSDNGQG